MKYLAIFLTSLCLIQPAIAGKQTKKPGLKKAPKVLRVPGFLHFALPAGQAPNQENMAPPVNQAPAQNAEASAEVKEGSQPSSPLAAAAAAAPDFNSPERMLGFRGLQISGPPRGPLFPDSSRVQLLNKTRARVLEPIQRKEQRIRDLFLRLRQYLEDHLDQGAHNQAVMQDFMQQIHQIMQEIGELFQLIEAESYNVPFEHRDIAFGARIVLSDLASHPSLRTSDAVELSPTSLNRWNRIENCLRRKVLARFNYLRTKVRKLTSEQSVDLRQLLQEVDEILTVQAWADDAEMPVDLSLFEPGSHSKGPFGGGNGFGDGGEDSGSSANMVH